MADAQRALITILLVVGLVFMSYLFYDTDKSLDSCKEELAKLNQLEWLKEQGVLDKPDLSAQLYEALHSNQNLIADLSNRNTEIQALNAQTRDCKSELSETQRKLRESEALVEETKLSCTQTVEEKIKAEFDPAAVAKLLWEIRTRAKPEILSHLGYAKPTLPEDDDELWDRAETVYKWMYSNFEFCRDSTATEDFRTFSFTSPDNLIPLDEDDSGTEEWCGDTDDFAMLFAGLMYASGVSEADLSVACGGNHCWNLLIKRSTPYDGWYAIDPACANTYYMVKYYGLSSLKKSFPGFWQNVKCFEKYDAEIIFGPRFYQIGDVTRYISP